MNKTQNVHIWGLFLSIALVVILLGASACNDDSDDPEPQTNTSGGSTHQVDESTQAESSQNDTTAQSAADTTQSGTATGDTSTGNTSSGQSPSVGELIIDHTCTDLAAIPSEWVEKAKKELHIAYGHTSHGSQLTTGMTGLVSFKGNLYLYNSGGTNGGLDLREPFPQAYDLGSPNRTAWAQATRNYLEQHSEVNVIMWSWCGQADTTAENINSYLSLMEGLEQEYPNVAFVYMTGHLNGTGLQGNLHLRNEQIRNYCKTKDKILYDFEDIESYDPDGTYFGNKIPDDACNYDSNGDGVRDANWALQWQESHTEGVDWYTCAAAHTKPLNANLKAYAAWWMWASLAGWQG